MDIKPFAATHNLSSATAQTVTDVYTNLQGLQGIKLEENQDEALKKVAKQFESMFINMMMKNMRSANAVFEEGNPFTSEEERFYRDLMDQQQALTLSHGRGIGIADSLYRQMSRTYGKEGSKAESDEKTIADYQASPVQTAPSITPNVIANSNSKNSAISNVKSETNEKSVEKTAQQRSAIANTPEEFIEKLTPYAKKAASVLGVDHLMLLAQSALETGWGKHVLSDANGNSSNNVFNIKAGGNWDKPSANHTTLEFEDGIVKKEQADFRVYESLAESFDDYVQFITESERYKKAVEHAKDAISFITELKQAGYATDPLYISKVKAVYDRLTQDSSQSGGDGR